MLKIGGTDDGHIHFRIVQHARQLRPFQLHNLYVFRVRGNIQRRWQQANIWFKGNQLLFLQQQQRAAEVGGIVWNRNGCAILQLRHRFNLSGVTRHREDEGIGHGDQRVIVRLVILCKERAMLEDVGVQFALVGGIVG